MKSILLSFFLLLAQSYMCLGQIKSQKPFYGISAITLGVPTSHTPTFSGFADLKDGGLLIDQFYRSGGNTMPTTPTQAKLYWDADSLYVLFSCANPGAINSILPRDDKVELYLHTNDMEFEGYYKFVASHFTGPEKEVKSGLFLANDRIKEVTGYTVNMLVKPDEWLAKIAVSWALLGEKPAIFDMMITRKRKLTSEHISPVGQDFLGNPALDQFMEVTFGKRAATKSIEDTFCELPSGNKRWQRPVKLIHLSPAEKKAVWELQQSLDQPTNDDNIADRIRLAQRWQDLLVIEGFPFWKSNVLWISYQGEYYPWTARRAINRALREGDVKQAGQELDKILSSFDQATQYWFADGTPGNVQSALWKPVERIEKVVKVDGELFITTVVAGRNIDFRLSFPQPGGIRLYTEPGFHETQELEEFELQSKEQSWVVKSGEIIVTIKKGSSWQISVSKGATEWKLQKGDISFMMENDRVKGFNLKHPLESSEVITGMGERFNGANQNGKIVTLWQLDSWEGIQHGISNHAYKIVPLMHSTKGYSLFSNSSYRTRADFGVGNEEHWRLTGKGSMFDFYLWLGTPLQNLDGYTALTGRPILAPKWAYEPWAGGSGRRWRSTKHNNPAKEVVDVISRFQQLDIPHSAIYAEGLGRVKAPELYTQLEPRGIRPFMWIQSGFILDYNKNIKMTPESDDHGYPVIRDTEGKPFFQTNAFIDKRLPAYKQFPQFDFTHPKAKSTLANMLSKKLDNGIVGSMVDFGDFIPEYGVQYHNGKSGEVMHNLNTYFYHKTFSEVYRERRGDDFVLFGRAGFPGTQAFVCNFAGDVRSNFYGFQQAMSAGLSVSASGFSNWGAEAGGYESIDHDFPTIDAHPGFDGVPEEESYIRWVQWSVFCPLMRFHGVGVREPWFYGNRAVEVYKKQTWLRENILDYTYSMAVNAHTTGEPIMRALSLIYPDEANLAARFDQYMFGSDLLIAPIFTTSSKREVELPPGQWTHLWDNHTIDGATKINTEAPIDQIPIFLRAGALIPIHISSDLTLGSSMTNNKIGALIVTPPLKSQSMTIWKDRTENAAISSVPTDDGFNVKIKDRPLTRYLLVYGLKKKIDTILVNGKPLKKYTNASEILTKPVGWHLDENGRLNIRLPYFINSSIDILYQS